MDVYRKKQQWDAASLPDPVISPLRSYRQLMDPPAERWPVFPTFDQRTLAGLVQEGLVDRGERPEAITERREEYARDLLLALDEDIRPPSRRTAHGRFSNGSRRPQRSISTIRNTIILLPTVVDVELGKCLSARSGIPLLLVISITPRRWFVNGIRILRPVNWATLRRRHSTKSTRYLERTTRYRRATDLASKVSVALSRSSQYTLLSELQKSSQGGVELLWPLWTGIVRDR